MTTVLDSSTWADMPDEPAKKSVFVVFVYDLEMGIDCCASPEFYYECACIAPAAFSSLQRAREFVGEICKRLHSQYSEERELARSHHAETPPFAEQRDYDFLWGLRIQLFEMLMAAETMTDEDLIQSMAFRERVKHTWCFNVDGKQLWELPDPAHGLSDFERYTFEQQYKIGDLVYVVPQLIEPASESILGEWAVVSSSPVRKDVWLDSGNAAEDWAPFYTVDFVHGDGYLKQYNVPEVCLSLPELRMQEKQAFLPIWSKFLRGLISFPDGLADRIRARKVYLIRCPRYDLASGSIID